MLFKLDENVSQRKQILLNRDVEMVKTLETKRVSTIKDLFKALNGVDFDIFYGETKEGVEITSLVVITKDKDILVPFSKPFTADESYEDVAELKSAEIYFANRKGSDDEGKEPEDFTGDRYMSIGKPSRIAGETKSERDERMKAKKAETVGNKEGE